MTPQDSGQQETSSSPSSPQTEEENKGENESNGFPSSPCSTLKQSCAFKKYAMIALPLLYFMYQFILRLWMGQVQEYEMSRLHLDAQHFGYINSAYYGGYTLLQIPIAVFFSRYSLKKVLSCCALLAAGAFFGGVLTTSFPIAVAMRFIVGAGSVAGILGLSKVISLWIPQKNYGSVFGLSISLGLFGLPLGQAPVKQWVEASGQYVVGSFIGFLGLVLALLIFLFLKEPSKEQNFCSIREGEQSQNQEPINIKDLGKIWTCFPLWLIGIVSLLLVGTFEGLADVWGQRFLVDFYSISKTTAASFMSFSFFGIIGGITLIPLLGERIGHFSAVLFCSLGLSLMALGFIYWPMSSFWICTVSFLLGIFSGYQTSLFSFGGFYAPKNINKEIVVAFINCINMAGGSFFHWGIPFVMNILWKQKVSLLGDNTGPEYLQHLGFQDAQGVPLYSVDMYQKGLFLIPLCSLLGGLLFLYFLPKKKQH